MQSLAEGAGLGSSEPMSDLTRRAVLASGLALAATAAGANTPRSAVPRLRPGADDPGRLADATRARIAEARLGGRVSYLVADARTGAVLGLGQPQRPMPPASTAKSITAAYALDFLGPGHRFVTQLIATGPVRDGRLEGDLVLAGGGDPLLTTDHLALMAEAAYDAGLREVAGGFAIWSGALPHVWEIDPAQPDHLRYNPSISGLNLNFNRVHFGWQARGDAHDLSLDARTNVHVPPISVIRARTDTRRLPVFAHDYDASAGLERWSVAQAALGASGTRWLPVRQSADYAAEVFQSFARARGIDLPRAVALDAPPRGAVLAAQVGDPLTRVLRGLLRYSTNLTAETVGLSATTAAQDGVPPVSLPESAAVMTDWARGALGMRDSRFVDHSGLSGLSRVTARDMVAALVTLGPEGPLAPVLREITLTDDAGEPEPMRLRAKTGTLNFVSALTGYIRTRRGRDLAFAILTDAPVRRAAVAPDDREAPAGTAVWSRRSREMQFDLCRIWAATA